MELELALGLIGVLLPGVLAGFAFILLKAQLGSRLLTKEEQLRREKKAAVLEAMRWLEQTQANRRR